MIVLGAGAFVTRWAVCCAESIATRMRTRSPEGKRFAEPVLL